MFPFAEPTVRVGLNPIVENQPEWNERAIAKQHGIVQARSFNDGTTQCFGLVVDKPRHLNRPNEELLGDVYKQVEQMGYQLVALDIRVGDRRRVYHPGKNEPVLDQRLL